MYKQFNTKVYVYKWYKWLTTERSERSQQKIQTTSTTLSDDLVAGREGYPVTIAISRAGGTGVAEHLSEARLGALLVDEVELVLPCHSSVVHADADARNATRADDEQRDAEAERQHAALCVAMDYHEDTCGAVTYHQKMVDWNQNACNHGNSIII